MRQLAPKSIQHLDTAGELGPLLLHLLAERRLVDLQHAASLGEMFLLEQMPVLHQRPFLLSLGTNRLLFSCKHLAGIVEFSFLSLADQFQFVGLVRLPFGPFGLELLHLLIVPGLAPLQFLSLAVPLSRPLLPITIQLLAVSYTQLTLPTSDLV